MKNIYRIVILTLLMVVGVSDIAQAEISTASCPDYIRSFLKRDNANNREEVIRLQTFLKEYEGLDVDINGTFDAKTESAVMAFQLKYKAVILAPWGATQPSGIVRVTTVKQINSLVCKQPLTLNQKDLSVISDFKQKAGVKSSMTTETEMTTFESPEASVSVEATSPVVVTTFTATSTTSQMLDKDSDDIEADIAMNTKVSNKVSISARFWAFVRGLFK